MKRFKTSADVILTFDNADEDGSTQEFYDAEINVRYPEGAYDVEQFETDVVKDILAGSKRNHDDLVKISLCYDSSAPSELTEEEKENHKKILDFLCRNNAKYYFQPNQRDDYEQAIVDALGIASKTNEI